MTTFTRTPFAMISVGAGGFFGALRWHHRVYTRTVRSDPWRSQVNTAPGELRRRVPCAPSAR